MAPKATIVVFEKDCVGYVPGAAKKLSFSKGDEYSGTFADKLVDNKFPVTVKQAGAALQAKLDAAEEAAEEAAKASAEAAEANAAKAEAEAAEAASRAAQAAATAKELSGTARRTRNRKAPAKAESEE